MPVPIYPREVTLLLLHTYDTRGLADDLTLLSDKTGTQNITFFFFAVFSTCEACIATEDRLTCQLDFDNGLLVRIEVLVGR